MKIKSNYCPYNHGYELDGIFNYFRNQTGDIFQEWERHHLVKKIYDNYWGYHTERIENAFADIDSLLKNDKPAW